jgi:hypothetical protein
MGNFIRRKDMTNPRENPVPQVTIRDIEHLAWAMRKKVGVSIKRER